MAKIALEFLRAVDAAADAFGPLKSAVGGALYIADAVQKFKTNEEGWMRFSTHIQDCLACVLLPDNGLDTGDDMLAHVKTLEKTLNEIKSTIQILQAQKRSKRIVTFFKDPEKINGMRQTFDDAIRIFQLRHMVTAGNDFTKLLGQEPVPRAVERLLEKFRDTIVNEITVVDAVHSAFPNVAGASWDPDRACFADTRVALFDEIAAWIRAADAQKSAEIFLISDVAGSGKSAIAHTVCQRFRDSLVSCFFFTRGVAGRDDYNMLLGHVIRDLAALSKPLTRKIGSILERDRTVATAGPSRQFDDLLLPLSPLYPTDRPLVIVIDALDEGYKPSDRPEAGLLTILRDSIQRLPGNFRILITCRPDNKIMPFLESKPHVVQFKRALSGEAAHGDVKTYVYQRLRQILTSKNLPEDLSYVSLLIEKSEGLFIWVATILNFLWTCTSPVRQLERLLTENSPSRLPAESKMDSLYQAILDSCNWDDEDFRVSYHLMMGTVLAAKSPISASAMQKLHGNTLSIGDMSRSPLRSLLYGLDANDVPIHILHLSLREFLTLRAPNQYMIDEEKHSQKLAQLCINILNRELPTDIPGLGFSTQEEYDDQTMSLPRIYIGYIAEPVLYACRFWPAHLISIKDGLVDESLRTALSFLVTNRLVIWMEVITLKDQFQSLKEVQLWAQKTLDNDPAIICGLYSEQVAQSAYNIALYLYESASYDQALLAIQEATALYERLAEDDSAECNQRLAMSLNTLSIILFDVGQVHEALNAIQNATGIYEMLLKYDPGSEILNAEYAGSLDNLSNRLYDVGQMTEALETVEKALKIKRRLAAKEPAGFKVDLAKSLHNLSNRLYDVGRLDEIQDPIREAIAIWRSLQATAVYPGEFDASLALSLNNFSNYLASMKQVSEALEAIEEAVALRRRLAADEPAKFNPDLAMSLNNLSNRLSDADRETEALNVIIETVALRRMLARDRPAKFNDELAVSLHNLSDCLQNVDQIAEALTASEEAVALYRILAADRPTRYSADLAGSLGSLANCLLILGNVPEALKHIKEAVALQRLLVIDLPAKHRPDLASLLFKLAKCLTKAKHHTKALETMKEVVTIWREMSTDQPERYTYRLSWSLYNITYNLFHAGQKTEALTAIVEAVAIQRTLVASEPETYSEELSSSLARLSHCLYDAGQEEEAQKAMEEAKRLNDGNVTNLITIS
ncbi:TPR-like protein [Artomyces pyxidatus]|uniref:TPR-like protein n=1 Tax=Artomyces pyxidatus TaxID=48021 RepID=A0ACB8T1P7_9AGAM|nr:TPR-like protein [Artomyces pyxidatus]